MSQRLQTFCRNCCSCKMQNHRLCRFRFRKSALQNAGLQISENCCSCEYRFWKSGQCSHWQLFIFCIHNLLSVTASACGSTSYQCATNNVVLYGLPFQSYDPCQCNLISSIVKWKILLKRLILRFSDYRMEATRVEKQICRMATFLHRFSDDVPKSIAAIQSLLCSTWDACSIFSALKRGPLERAITSRVRLGWIIDINIYGWIHVTSGRAIL